MKKKFLSHYLIHQFKLRGKIIQNENKNKNRKPYRKPITKAKLEDALDFALTNLRTVDYNNNTSMDDLETVDYYNNTSVRDLVPVKYEIKDEENRLETIETRNHW